MSSMLTTNGVKELTDAVGGISLEVDLILHEDNADDERADWEVGNLKFSIKQPVIGISLLKYVTNVSLSIGYDCV